MHFARLSGKLRLDLGAWRLFLADRVTDLRHTFGEATAVGGKSCHNGENPCESTFRASDDLVNYGNIDIWQYHRAQDFSLEIKDGKPLKR